jgi:hypothetical protein
LAFVANEQSGAAAADPGALHSYDRTFDYDMHGIVTIVSDAPLPELAAQG